MDKQKWLTEVNKNLQELGIGHWEGHKKSNISQKAPGRAAPQEEEDGDTQSSNAQPLGKRQDPL